jgi:hypothetical protein
MVVKGCFLDSFDAAVRPGQRGRVTAERMVESVVVATDLCVVEVEEETGGGGAALALAAGNRRSIVITGPAITAGIEPALGPLATAL